MKQKPLSGDPFIGKKHVILLTMFNLMPMLLYLGFWVMAIFTNMVSDRLLAVAYFIVMYGLFGLFFIILGYALILLRINIARVIMETIYLCVGIGVMTFFVLAPIMLTWLGFSLVCLFDFAVLFFDKHIHAYTHSRETEDMQTEAKMPKPLI